MTPDELAHNLHLTGVDVRLRGLALSQGSLWLAESILSEWADKTAHFGSF